MTQIKLSIAFVLAAAAIAPIVAQPIREGHEFAGDVVPHRHRLRHHHHHHQRVANPEQSSLDTPPPSPREYVEEFEARGLLFGQNDDLSLLKLTNKEKTLDAQLEHKHQVLEGENRHLEHKNRHLGHKERHLEHKDHRLEHEDRKLEHRKHSHQRVDKSLLGKKHRLGHEDNKLDHKHKTLEAEDKTFEGKHHSLTHKNKVLGRKDKKLAHEGKVLAHQDKKLKLKGKALAHHNEILGKEGEVLAHHDKVHAQEGKALRHGPVVHSEHEIVAREYDDFDEVFERDSESLPGPYYKSPPGRHFRFGLPTVPRARPLRAYKFPRFGGHGPVVFPGRRPSLSHGGSSQPNKLHFGPGPVRLPHRPVAPIIVDREYAEIEDVVERDFEDDEFDARDFEDELYLD